MKGPGRPRAFDPERALDRAMEVFWRKGYESASLSDLTAAMGINRPSLYSTFGGKESLFHKALARYAEGPSSYLRLALEEPTARAVAERMMRGAVDVGTGKHTPPGCMWVRGALSCGDPKGRLGMQMAAQRAEGAAKLRKRFERAVAEGDLPPGTNVAALARYVATVNFGLSVQAATGATRKALLRVVALALQAWPTKPPRRR
jgi:AcrR family transcriptional regulator